MFLGSGCQPLVWVLFIWNYAKFLCFITYTTILTASRRVINLSEMFYIGLSVKNGATHIQF